MAQGAGGQDVRPPRRTRGGAPRTAATPRTPKILRLQPFDQLCNGRLAGQDPPMPRVPRRRGAQPRRLRAACATAAVATVVALVPVGQAAATAPSPASCATSKKPGPPPSAVVAEILAAARAGV